MSRNLKWFASLLAKYHKGITSTEENRFLDNWYNFLHNKNEKDTIEDPTLQSEMWSQIEKGMFPPDERQVNSSKLWKNTLVRLAAASVVLLISFLIFQKQYQGPPVIAGVEDKVLNILQQTKNNSEVPKLIFLSDQSQVRLEPGATIYFPSQFDSLNRTVYLDGDAFFEITPNKNKPFVVHANNIITRVVGTSFTIKENKLTKSTEVAVITGIVEVQKIKTGKYPTKDSQKVVLTPNKKVTFFEEDANLVTGIVERPEIIKTAKPETTSFYFKEKSIAYIIPILEKAYGVQIKIKNERLYYCTVTADLTQDKGLFAQLEVLCAAIDARFEIVNDNVILSGNGCAIN